MATVTPVTRCRVARGMGKTSIEWMGSVVDTTVHNNPKSRQVSHKHHQTHGSDTP